VLATHITNSQLRYLDLSWNSFAVDQDSYASYSESLRQILQNNYFLQKVLVMHN